MNMNFDIYYRTLVMHVSAGLLASQCPDFRYIDVPGKTKEQQLSEDAFAYADALMLTFEQRESKNGTKDS